MELFEAFVAEMVRWSNLTVRVEVMDGQPALVTGETRLPLADQEPSLEEDHPLAPFAHRLRRLWRIWEVCSTFPMGSPGGITVTIAPPDWGIDSGGLRARLDVVRQGGGAQSLYSLASVTWWWMRPSKNSARTDSVAARASARTGLANASSTAARLG